MRIYKMTATFGKLEHATLELEPGLNIITAPNEWGKSTWCAFLVAMLYGLDTRAKTTKTVLADKERYAPWSGAPMAGRIDLCWKDRDITIERRTKRRVPLGEFQAYETASGLPIPELTAANCGQLLLGVEQTVFRRAGFIRHADLPVTQDEALRRRLNALVTTGDDSGAADRLADSLRELKNKCRYNRSGLLPQAEAQRDALEEKLAELEMLDAQSQKIRITLDELREGLKQLYNHQQALAYEKMEADLARLSQMKSDWDQTQQELNELEEICAGLPSREEVEAGVRELRSFRELWTAIQMEQKMAPAKPLAPVMEPPYTGMTAEEARQMAKEDAKIYTAMSATKMPLWLMAVGVFGILAAAGLAFLRAYIFAGLAGLAGIAAVAWGIYERAATRRQVHSLVEKYGDANWKHWLSPITRYEQELAQYEQTYKNYQDITSDLEVRLMVLRKKRETLCGDQEPESLLEQWQQALEVWNACLSARREAGRAKAQYEALAGMIQPAEKPAMEDHLTQSEAETARLLSEYAAQQQRLQNRLGQCQGRMELLGDPEDLRSQLQRVRQRMDKLEQTYAALSIAQETLAAARTELQRRFAPRITKRAQKLLSEMTAGRYHSLTMSEDFSLQAGAGEEDTLHDAIWRSDGTMDQLYLALRLAVAEELTPEAPLVLDDALVRFDDIRLAAALDILRSLAQDKQIICFTCQGREENL